MIDFLLMLICFALWLGIAVLVYKYTHFTGVESVGMAVVAIIVIQLIAGILGSLKIGTIMAYTAGGTG